MFRRIANFLILALFVMLPPIHPVSAQTDSNILRYPINADPEYLNPFTASTIAVGTVLNNIYETLFALEPKTGQLTPRLAESWTVSPDQLTYTFHLRKGVYFQNVDGVKYESNPREFNANDWLWAARLSLNKDHSISTHPEWLAGVVGAADFASGKASGLAGVVAMDNYTLQVTLAQPNRLFLMTLGVPAVPHEAYEQLGDKFATTPVGTGPFQFVEWQRDNYISLKANPNYWQKGFPKVAGIRFMNIPDANTELLQYQQNTIDFLFHLPTGQRAAIIKKFAQEYTETPNLNIRYFAFKMDKGFFADHPLVRQAFAHALNRDLIWNDLMEGARFPGDLGVLPPAMIASKPSTIYDYNLTTAAQLLTQAGFPNGQGMPEITLYVFASASTELSFPVLQQDLAQLGVKLTIKVEDDSTYWNHIEQDDVQFFLSGWSSGTLDPANVFNYLLMDGLDTTHYSNLKVNDLLHAALQETNLEARTKLYQQAHDLIMADSPWIVSA